VDNVIGFHDNDLLLFAAVVFDIWGCSPTKRGQLGIKKAYEIDFIDLWFLRV
jgi:hypothetical protein